MSGNFGLKINEDVLAKMASLAASEVPGVHTLSTKVASIKDVAGRVFGKSVRASVASDGEVTLDVYISVKQSANVKEVAESVQKNVKEKVQNMTGNAVSRVNVHVADVEFDVIDETPAPEENDAQ